MSSLHPLSVRPLHYLRRKAQMVPARVELARMLVARTRPTNEDIPRYPGASKPAGAGDSNVPAGYSLHTVMIL